MAYKRKRGYTPKSKSARSFRKAIGGKKWTAMRNKRSYTPNKRIKRLERMIETKEGGLKTGTNISLPHNQIYIVKTSGGGDLNPFVCITGTSDVMGDAIAQRVGDAVSCRGILFKAYFENALQRSRVHYRIYLVRMAKGDTLTRATFFKNNCGNKIIDQINTERYTIVASKKFTINVTNAAPSNVSATGVAEESAAYPYAGIGTKAFSMWVPGRKFGRDGYIKYENNTAQVKFYDYKFVIMAYDWFGTPDDIAGVFNNVGKLNEGYCKMYYKDA